MKKNDGRIKKGEVRNPKGRPKIKPIREIIQLLEDEGEISVKNVIQEIYNDAVLEHDNAARKLFLEYAFGKPQQNIQLDQDTNITISFANEPKGLK